MKHPHKLTNRDIHENYMNIEMYINKAELLSAFSYWILFQNPYIEKGVDRAIKAYNKFLNTKFTEEEQVIKLNPEELKSYVSSDLFESIPEIFKLNQTKPDFIDLGALSHNIFYMILRLEITQPLS